MLLTQTTYIGIDPTAGQKPFTYAALDESLKLLAMGQGEMNEVLAFLGGQRAAFACVCSPSHPANGVLERPEIRQQLNPPPRPGRWQGFRLSEYQMRQHNIHCPKTGSDPANSPNWIGTGFKLYQRMESIGYRAYPQEDTELQWLESYPHAAYTALLEVLPFAKDTFEGRIQRQLILYENKLRLSDPMVVFEEITRHRLLQGILPTEDLYATAELDALVAAYTAWLVANHPERTSSLGHPDEGLIILPVSELKKRYTNAVGN